jgi:mannosyltransferase OCH1-like enzyme
VPEPSAFEVERTNKKLKRNKSRGTDQIPVVLINAGVRTIRSGINRLINYTWNNEELPHQWKELSNEPLYRKGDK